MHKYLKTFLIVSICALLAPVTGFCQLSPSIPQWVDDIGGSGSSVVSLEKIDRQNNVYITGIFSGTVDFDPSPAGVKNITSSGNSVDTYIAKYDTNGKLIWAVSVGGSGTDQPNGIDVDNSGNVTITGQYNSPVLDANPGTGVSNLTNAGGTDMFVINLDVNGGFLWAKQIGGSQTDYGNKVAIDNANNRIMVGQFQSTINVNVSSPSFTSTGTFNGLIIKYDASGNFKWAINLGQTGDNAARGVVTDANNNIIVTGNFSGVVNFNPLGAARNLTSTGTAFFIAKYDTNGILSWVQIVNGNTAGSANICVDSNNNIYLDGTVISTLTFPGGTTLSLFGNQDIFLSKFASDGTFQWAKDIGGRGARASNNGITVSGDDNIYISGYFTGSMDFDPSASVALVKYHGQQDFFLAKYNTSGIYQWAISGGSANCNQTFGRAVGVDSNNDVLLSGAFCSTVNFDVSGCTSFNVTAQSNIRDSFLAKYVPDASVVANNTITAPATTICTSNIPGVITGSVATVGTGTPSYQWQTSSNNITFTNIAGATSKDYDPRFINATTYLRRTVTSGTCAVPLISNVIVLTLSSKIYTTTPNSTICRGEHIVINASGTGVNTFSWSPADGLSNTRIANPTASPLVTTTYTVLITSGTCSVSVPVTITVLQPPVVNAGTDLQINNGESIKLNGSITGGDNVQYQWSPTTYLDNPNILNPTATPHKNITYTLTATTGNGCFSISDDVSVKVYYNVIPPNTFTPNSDGINDTWNIPDLSTYSSSELNIYNRYGTLIFKSIGYPKAWDGKYNNQELPAGTYYYTIDLKNGSKILSGWVAIVR